MNQEKIISKILRLLLPYIAFFGVTYVYFGYISDYVLYYQEKSSLFIFSFDFLKENITHPGAILIWFGKLLSAFYFHPETGALILAAVLTLIILCVSKILNIYKCGDLKIISFIIGIALFFLQTDYRFLLFNSLGLLLQLTFCLFIINNKTIIKGWLSVAFVPVFYFISGGFIWIYLIFMTLELVINNQESRWIRLGSIWIFSALIYFISSEFLFFQSGESLITFPLFNFNAGIQQKIFISVAASASILPVLTLMPIRESGRSWLSGLKLSMLITISVILIMVLISMQQFEIKTKKYFYVEKLFEENRFDDVIAFNISNPPTNLLTVYLNNVALSEKGKLNDLLFHFPQSPDGRTLFLRWKLEGEILNHGGYFYYTSGMINEAHRWAYENMVMKGNTPAGLKMLIKTDIINGNYKIATRYINILKETLYHNSEAESFEKILNNELKGDSDDEFKKRRQTIVKNDFFTLTDDPSINLEIILTSDTINKNAFAYKFAYLLLKKDFTGIMHELPKFEKFGFKQLPVHAEEAAIAMAVSNKGKLPDTGNLVISNKTQLRWNEYLSVLKNYRNNVQAAEPVLKRRFGDTYWYYVFFK